ncbi:ankyrin repeat-containing domain protein [Lophiotrema nucula]|uniref:protein S-acyltransferase n=1 Tax=Lophiotrema nucula TaxID=690887 RepID=A0A6A5ZSK5_9PLEO|nr:ankyrin repeat-containing domain protein [Lophiotrema nucula]
MNHRKRRASFTESNVIGVAKTSRSVFLYHEYGLAQRCDRCIEKDFPCSEGTLADRRSIVPVSGNDSVPRIGGTPSNPQDLSQSPGLPSREDAIHAVDTMMRYLQGQSEPTASFASGAMQKEPSGIRDIHLQQTRDREKEAKESAEKGRQSKMSQSGTKSFPDYTFLLSYHALLDTAMKRLQDLERDTLEVFQLTLDKSTYVSLLVGTDRQKFDAFVSKLQFIALWQACEVLIKPERAQHSAGFSALMGKLLAQRPVKNDSSCSICNEAESERLVLEKCTQTDDIGSEFMIRQRRLIVHYRTTNHLLPHEINQDAVEAEWFRYIELLFEIDSKGSTLLADYDLVDIAAFLGQTLVVPLPDELGIQGDKLRLLRCQPDCLGRTELHFYLDSTAVERMRGEGLMQRALQSQLYDNADLLGRTPLHLASLKENESLVQELLRAGANPSHPTILGHTPLHYAAASKSLPVCRKLLGIEGIDINWMDKLGNAPLFYAVQSQNEEMVELLLLNDEIDPDWGAAEQYPTPFLKAIQLGNESILRHLLNSGSDPNQTYTSSFEGYSALHYAIIHRRVNVLKLLASSTGISINVQDKLGATPLCMAAEVNLVEAIDYFLTLSSVDVNARNYKTQDTALMVAAAHGCMGVCERLLDQNHTQINCGNINGETALIKAVRYGHVGVVRLLLQDPRLLVNVPDAEGRTALLEAVEHRRMEELCLLLRHPETHVNVSDKRRRTALSQAARQDYNEIVQELLKQPGIDVNIQIEDDRTALHEAARKGALKTVEVLLTHPTIDLNVKNRYGQTARTESMLNGHTDIPEILTKHLDINGYVRD